MLERIRWDGEIVCCWEGGGAEFVVAETWWCMWIQDYSGGSESGVRW